MNDQIRAVLDQIKATEERRPDTMRRLVTDPVAHAVGHLLRQAVDVEPGTGERDTAILDGTAAILDLFAAAEARGRREGQQWAIDALRDSQAYMEWVRVGQKAGTQPRRASYGVGDVMWAGDYLDAITKEGRQDG